MATFFVGAKSLNNINMVFEDFENIDLSFLGTPNLTQYDAKVSFGYEPMWIHKNKREECIYKISIDFNPDRKETAAGDTMYGGRCAANDAQGNADDDLPWHTPRRHWMRLPEELVDATGLNHLSMEWVPCGRAPAGFQQARWDLNFYTVIPEYRSFMICDTFKTPKVCQYNQTTHLGRRMFTLARLALEGDVGSGIANIPKFFKPDAEYPEAYEYEGLMHYDPDPEITPINTTNWTLPTFTMSTYDAETVSWRAMIPHSYFAGKWWVKSREWQYYVYQTQMGLPTNWSTFYDGDRMYVDVLGPVLDSHKHLCYPDELDPINGGKKDDIIVLEPNDHDLH